MPAPIAVTPDKADVWEEVLEELVQDISELPTFWRDQARPFVDADQTGFVTLFVTEDVVVGVPERRLECNLAAPAGEEIEPTIAELHRIALQIQVETYDNSAKARGRFFASRIRTRLRTEASILTLARVETSLIDISPIISAAVPVDNRQSSAATMTVRLHAATVERERPFGYIDVLRLVPELEDEAGNPIAIAPIDVDLPDP